MKAIFKDAFNLLCGELLGEGIHRKVYECMLRPELVVKVEAAEARYFANVLEMKFWTDNQHIKRIQRWLAPCEYMSPDGRILLQRRVDPLPQEYKLPSKMPSFLTDLKRSNYGLLNGRLVCADYGMVVHEVSSKLEAVEWA